MTKFDIFIVKKASFIVKITYMEGPKKKMDSTLPCILPFYSFYKSFGKSQFDTFATCTSLTYDQKVDLKTHFFVSTTRRDTTEVLLTFGNS